VKRVTLLPTAPKAGDYMGALVAVANASPCEVIHGDKPDGWTCLDSVRDARNPAARYAEEYRLRVLRGDTLCDGCRRKVTAYRALGLNPVPPRFSARSRLQREARND
jgi:hypothetical protein